MDRIDKSTDEKISYQIHTYGCKVNSYDSGLLQNRLGGSGFVVDQDQPQVHILNTCAVTAEATKEAVRQIRRLKVKNPLAKVVVTGCAAQVATEQFADLPGADLVVANSHKGELEDLIQKSLNNQLTEKTFKSNIFKKEDLEAGGGVEKDHTRSFLKIQDGCNSFCTYCVIPFARGKSRSIEIDDLVQRVQQLYSQGVREVVLTGVHIGDYSDEFFGKENARGLEDLIEQLLLRTDVQRFRLSSLEPVELTPRLIELYQDPRMCAHFHMSIQSATTKVLSDMKRQYSAKDVEFSLQQIENKIPGAFVGMDVIVGFPTETESDFEETYQRLQSLAWTRIHVFPYSERPGTYAVRYPQKNRPEVIKERSRRLRELSSDRYAIQALQQIGRTKKGLVIKGRSPRVVTRDYWTVLLEGAESLPVGQEIDVQVLGYDHSESGRMTGFHRGRVL